MAIISSRIVFDSAQRDGRRHVRERHVDNHGVSTDVDYVAEAAANVTSIMAARIPQLEAGSVTAELEQIAIDLPEPPTLRYATWAQVRAFIRERFKSLRGLEVGRMAKWLLNMTDAELRAAFGITQAQVTALRIRLQAAADRYTAAQALEGE